MPKIDGGVIDFSEVGNCFIAKCLWQAMALNISIRHFMRRLSLKDLADISSHVASIGSRISTILI